jgi:hypothetical protein
MEGKSMPQAVSLYITPRLPRALPTPSEERDDRASQDRQSVPPLIDQIRATASADLCLHLNWYSHALALAVEGLTRLWEQGAEPARSDFDSMIELTTQVRLRAQELCHREAEGI